MAKRTSPADLMASRVTAMPTAAARHDDGVMQSAAMRRDKTEAESVIYSQSAGATDVVVR